MKLTPEVVAYILNAVKTAKLVGIDNIIIEPNLVRAIDENRNVVLLQDKNVPDMPFVSIGLTRIDTFLARYEIAKTQDNFTVEAVVADNAKCAQAIVMKGKHTKIDYRCGNPLNITAPRQLNDTLKYQIQLNAEAVSLLQRGQVAMGAEIVSIVSNEGVSFELTDVNNDVFKHVFAEDATPLTTDEDTKFVYRYPVKILLALFRNNPEGDFSIGAKGILCFRLNGLTTYVMPQA